MIIIIMIFLWLFQDYYNYHQQSPPDAMWYLSSYSYKHLSSSSQRESTAAPTCPSPTSQGNKTEPEKKLALVKVKVKVKMPSWLFCWICVERNLDGGADEEPKVGADIQVGGVVAQPVVDLKIAKVELNWNFTHQRVGDPVECDEEEVPSTGWVGGPPLHHRVYAGETG